MSFFGDLLGDTGAEAARSAAADTYAKQQAAIGKLIGYGDDYAQQYKDLSHQYDPYVATGNAGNAALLRLLQDPSSVASLPGYQFDMQQGVNALDRSAAARGTLNSGRSQKDLLAYGTGLADNTYGSQLQRLLGVSQFGQGANAAQIGTVGQGLAGQLGTRTTAYGGDMTAAGTIGQGEIAAANAKAQGAQNVMNGIGKIAGSAFSAFSGMPGGGFGASSYGGGTPGYNTSPSMGGAGTGFDQYGRMFSFG